LNTDIVVIGGGTAGLAAALTALEHGTKKVILLEKRINCGGNSAMAGGFIFGAESRLQKKEGKLIYKDIACQQTLANNHFDRINPRLIRTLINRSGDTIDWLESQGMEFMLSQGDNYVHQIKGKFTDEIMKKSLGIIMQYSLGIEILVNKVKGKGGEILLRTAAKKIIRDEKGKISGVIAATRDGEEIQIKCKSVILSPGGFTGNKELLKKYFNYDDFATEALPLKGDGIKMAEEAGAYLEDYATLSPHSVHPRYISLETMKNQPNRRVVSGPTSIWVNAKGIRFIDVGTAVGNTRGINKLFLRQPNKAVYSLIDEKILQTPIPKGAIAGPGGDSKIENHEQNVIKVRKELQAAANNSTDVCISDDWKTIAKYIGADPATLSAAIKEYNSYCDRGVDEIFGKDKKYLMPLRNPPYYVIKLQAGMDEAIGPVRINEHMEVLDKKEDPIPGFYAAGAITSGWCGHDYDISGSNLGFATTGGRIAGENASLYIAKKSK